MYIISILLTVSFLVGCQQEPYVRPNIPEWHYIGRVFNDSWPHTRKKLLKHKIVSKLKPDYPISEVWIKAEQSELYRAAVEGGVKFVLETQ
jgi:hypothetical protein